MSLTHLVTGVAGQDGILLARLLLARGDTVVGTVRPGSSSPAQMAPYLAGVRLVELDLRDAEGFARVLEEHRPDRVFNLAGHSSVGTSWAVPELVAAVNGDAVAQMLTQLATHRDRHDADVRFCQASSAEEHGAAAESPYALAKSAASAAVRRARESDGLHASTVVLHNHESPVRGRGFVTRKITRAAAEISLGRASSVQLGNLAVTRDWGAASDYVEAMAAITELDQPDDLRIATGVLHTLDDLLVTAFAEVGLDDPMQFVEQSPGLHRPQDTPVSGAPEDELARTREVLGWAASTTFAQVVGAMVRADVRRVQSGVEESVDYLDA